MYVSEKQVEKALSSALGADPALAGDLVTDPKNATTKLAAATAKQLYAFTGDRLLYRIAVAVLGALTLITAIGAIYLVVNDHGIPDVLVALGSASVGALVGLFATPPSPGSS